MVDIICALCGKKQQTRVLYKASFDEKKINRDIYNARRIPDRVHYRILKCVRCGLIFSSPIFPLSKIANLYKESECNYKAEVPFLIKTYYKYFHQLKETLPKNLKVLEIGCGNGFFLEALIKNDIKDVFGVEPSQKMISQSSSYLQKRIKVSLFKDGMFPENSFDVVCCFHTLDHIVEVNQFMKSVHKITKNLGYAYFIVHNVESIYAKIIGEKFPIFDIEHIYLFSKNTLSQAFSDNGFRNNKIFNIINYYSLSYFVKMSPMPDITKKYLQNILEKLKISTISLPFFGGNIGIIGQKIN